MTVFSGIDLTLIIEQVLAEQALGESPFRRDAVSVSRVTPRPLNAYLMTLIFR